MSRMYAGVLPSINVLIFVNLLAKLDLQGLMVGTLQITVLSLTVVKLVSDLLKSRAESLKEKNKEKILKQKECFKDGI